MHDGPLHVSKLSQLTPHAEFAMLLACETAKGERLLLNEAIHIVASFQFAGFRSVIGTLQPFAELRAQPDFFKKSPELGSNGKSPVAHSFLHVLL
jgi:hypothetical protein